MLLLYHWFPQSWILLNLLQNLQLTNKTKWWRSTWHKIWNKKQHKNRKYFKRTQVQHRKVSPNHLLHKNKVYNHELLKIYKHCIVSATWVNHIWKCLLKIWSMKWVKYSTNKIELICISNLLREVILRELWKVWRISKIESVNCWINTANKS